MLKKMNSYNVAIILIFSIIWIIFFGVYTGIRKYNQNKLQKLINEISLSGIVNISSVPKYPEFIQATDFTAGTFLL